MFVNIDKGDPSNPKGMPRPLAMAPDGKRRPVPYTNKVGGMWGQFRQGEGQVVQHKHDCLLCGEPVEYGLAFVPFSRVHWTVEGDCPVTLDATNVGKWATDQAPLHTRCARMTEAHCMKLRLGLLHGNNFLVPYIRDGLPTDIDKPVVAL